MLRGGLGPLTTRHAVGDPLYVVGGLPAPEGAALPGDPGYHLHAAELHFWHPESELRVKVHADPPPVLQRSG